MKKKTSLYLMLLVVTFCSCDKPDNSQINNIAVPNITDIKYTVLNCRPPYKVRFNYLTDPATAYNSYTCKWDFGNGTTADSCAPVYATFAAQGIYNVKLTLQNSGGKVDKTVAVDLTNTSFAVTSSFDPPQAAIYVGCSVSFANTSTHSIAYFWDFGDSTTSSEFQPSHQFNRPGSFTVKLVAMCNGDTARYSRTINVYATPSSFTLNNFWLSLPLSTLDSDIDDADFRPDYYLAVYLNNTYVTSTNVIYNIGAYPVGWSSINHTFSLTNPNDTIYFYVYDRDDNGTDDYSGYFFYLTNEGIKNNCYTTSWYWGSLFSCGATYF